MLSASNQLRHNNEFRHVLKNGKRHYFGGVLLYYTTNTVDTMRCGFIVGKKYSLLAVARNRQRRILQHAMRDFLPQILPNIDIVISYTNHGKVLPYKQAHDVLKKIFSQHNLFIQK